MVREQQEQAVVLVVLLAAELQAQDLGCDMV